MMQIILFLIFIACKSAIALLPGNCTLHQCEHESVCKNHYDAEESLTAFLCSELEVFMVDMFNFQSCVVLGHSCHCEIGFSGELCERSSLKTDSQSLKCRQDLCLNNGSCLSGNDHEALCSCKEGFSGQFCEQKIEKATIDPCNPPCFNKGTCTSVTSEYTCVCENEFLGQNCTEILLNSTGKNYTDHSQTRLNGTLEVVVIYPPAEFIPKLNEFLKNMTVFLKTEVILKEDENGALLFNWKDGVTGERLSISKRSLLETRSSRLSITEGVILTLEVNVGSCTENCFSDVDSIANYIEKAVASKDPALVNWIIYEAKAIHAGSEPRQNDKETSIWKYIMIGAPFVALALFWIFVAGKDKVMRTTVWIPPKEYEILQESPVKRIKNEDAILPAYGQLILPKIQPKPKYEQLTELHLQAISQQQIQHPINRTWVNLKTGIQGLTPLHFVVINSIKTSQEAIFDIQRLISAGANVNLQNYSGETALYLACRYQKSEIAGKLLSLEADPSIHSYIGSTPLHQAAHNNDLKTVEELLKCNNVKVMINEVDAFDRTPLMVSALEDVLSCKIADRLISAGAEMGHSGNQCNMAVCNGKTALHCAVESSNIQMIKFLVRKGANKDAQDKKGRTSLFLAAELGNMDCVRVLMELGSSNEVTDQRDMTPQDVANFVGLKDIANYVASYKPVSPTQPRQIAVTKVKKTAKRKWLPPTPPSSDESITSTSIEIEDRSATKTSDGRIRAFPSEQHFPQENDYSPQGMNNDLLAQPYYWNYNNGHTFTKKSKTFSSSTHEEDGATYPDYTKFINL